MAIIKIKNQAIDLDAAEIPNLPATKITSGTFDNARISLDAAEIPNLDTAKITTGTLADAQIAFETQGALDFSIGIDRSDSNKFVMSRAGTLGTNNVFTIDGTSATFTGNVTANNITLDNILLIKPDV